MDEKQHTQDSTPSLQQAPKTTETKDVTKEGVVQEKKPEHSHSTKAKEKQSASRAEKVDESKTLAKDRDEPKKASAAAQETRHPHKAPAAEHKEHKSPAQQQAAHVERSSHFTPHQEHEAQPTVIHGDAGKASPEYWKLAAVILGIAFVITLFAQNWGSDVPSAPEAPTQQGADAAAPTQGAPQLADTSKDPAVTLTVLNDPGCQSCDTSQVLSVLTGRVFPKTTVKTVDVNSAEGRALAEKYEINAIPAYIYEKDVEDSVNFAAVAEAMLDKGDAYLIHPAATGAGKYLNPPDEDDDPVLGDKDAPVTIVEFSDYECPFCGRFRSDTLPKIKEQYIRTGKVKFVYRDFPLPIHPNAQKAAEAAECADDQGQFWAYHDKLFENQRALDVANLKKYAKDLGLDTAEFDACLDSGRHADEVKKDTEDGANGGVSGTPAFFINGVPVSGAQPFEAFQQVIDAALEE